MSASTEKNYLQQQTRSGSLVPKPIAGRPRAITAEDEAALRPNVTAQPTSSLAQLCA